MSRTSPSRGPVLAYAASAGSWDETTMRYDEAREELERVIRVARDVAVAARIVDEAPRDVCDALAAELVLRLAKAPQKHERQRVAV